MIVWYQVVSSSWIAIEKAGAINFSKKLKRFCQSFMIEQQSLVL